MFAVVNQNGEATTVSTTERGAKCYATRHNFNIVCQVNKFSMTCYNLSHKIGKKWKSEKQA